MEQADLYEAEAAKKGAQWSRQGGRLEQEQRARREKGKADAQERRRGQLERRRKEAHDAKLRAATAAVKLFGKGKRDHKDGLNAHVRTVAQQHTRGAEPGGAE